MVLIKLITIIYTQKGVIDVPRIHQGSYIPIFRSQPSEVLHSVIQVSCLESKRTLYVPERSLGRGYSPSIKFKVTTFPGSAPSSMCLQSVIMESKRTLEFLTWVLVVLVMVDVSRIQQDSCVYIFKSLRAWEVLHFLCVSRVSSWRFLTGVLVVFDMVDAPKIHQGSYLSIFRSLPSRKVVQLLGEGGTNKTWHTHWVCRVLR